MAVKFKVPTSVELLGKKISITRAPLKNAHAEYDRIKNSIVIDTDCPDDLLEASLMHECVHAALWITGMSQLLSDQLEEALCFSMENLISIFQVRR